MKTFTLGAILSLAMLVSGAALAQGNSGKGGGGGGGGPPSFGGGSPFPSTPTVTPTAPAPMPSSPTMTTPIGGSTGGGSGFGTPAVDPLSTPSTPLAAGTPPPVDRYRELHGHAHAHLCKAKGCDQYCDGRERAVAADKRDTFTKQCRSYCMEKC